VLDLKIIRNNPELIKESIKKRNLKIDLDIFLDIDSKRNKLLVKIDKLREVRNRVSKEIPNLKDLEKKSKIIEMKQLWDDLKKIEQDKISLDKDFFELYYSIPNFLDKRAAIWLTDEENIVESTFLTPTKFEFKTKTHYEIWEKKWWIDIEKGSEVSGSRFWYLKWDLVLLQFAIINYAITKMVSYWFEPILPPILTREKAMFWTGFLPSDEDWLYQVNPWEDDLYLVWTSEVPVTSYHAWETLDLTKPKMYAAYSSCFRREAWSAWKDTKWISRWHQFDKIEMVVFCKPEESDDMHKKMVSIEENIWQWLWIPYQKLNVCSWDLWNPAMIKNDLEAWMPGQNKFREVTSCSNVWQYQSRRLWIKYKDDNWKSNYVNTLNGTVIALSRCIIAIMENYQTAEWDIVIPEILRPFMWWKDKI